MDIHTKYNVDDIVYTIRNCKIIKKTIHSFHINYSKYTHKLHITYGLMGFISEEIPASEESLFSSIEDLKTSLSYHD